MHGAAELERSMSKKGETLKALKEDINIVDVCLTFINDFLRSMLDMNRANADKLHIKASPVDLKTSIFEPINTMVRSRDADYEFIVDCPDDLIVMTDSLRLKQIVLNLVRNSVKFIHYGFIRLRADVKNGMVCLYVEDSGPGIPLEKRNALFQKFQSSLDMLSQGTGVGLCLCKSLIDAMGGEISLDESFVSGVAGNPGVSFVIALNQPKLELDAFEKQDEEEGKDDGVHAIESPNFEESAPNAAIVAKENPPKAVPSVLPESLKVLFVDDDNMIRKLFCRAVKRVAPGWTIQEAANGETALRLVETDEFDLIFMDMYMASVNKQLLGTETIQALRSRGVKSRICGLSANYLEDDFLKVGADFFLLKPMPCKKDELTEELNRIVVGPRAVPSLEFFLGRPQE
jgi:CheY-like chemotaxis protein